MIPSIPELNAAIRAWWIQFGDAPADVNIDDRDQAAAYEWWAAIAPLVLERAAGVIDDMGAGDVENHVDMVMPGAIEQRWAERALFAAAKRVRGLKDVVRGSEGDK